MDQHIPTNCHLIFQTEDILEVVLSFFDEEAFRGNIFDIEKSTQTSLRSAALVSKTFFRPAIALLWRMLDSIMPVLNLIPSLVIVDDSYVRYTFIDA